jgi:hypothetical protein
VTAGCRTGQRGVLESFQQQISPVSCPACPTVRRMHPLIGKRYASLPERRESVVCRQLTEVWNQASGMLQALRISRHEEWFGPAIATPDIGTLLLRALRYEPNITEITLSACAAQADPNGHDPAVALTARLAAWLADGNTGTVSDWLADQVEKRKGPLPRHEAEWLHMTITVPDRMVPWPTPA